MLPYAVLSLTSRVPGVTRNSGWALIALERNASEQARKEGAASGKP